MNRVRCSFEVQPGVRMETHVTPAIHHGTPAGIRLHPDADGWWTR